MAVEVVAGSPLAQALQDAVHPKLVEAGWSTGGEDSALSEYIILMLVNGKTQDQIASELANDLLGLGEGDTGATDFAQWLFAQVDALNTQLNGAPALSEESGAAAGQQTASAAGDGADMAMDDASIPTGPRNMTRNGNGPKSRDRRMFNQLNKNMDRSKDVLNQTRGSTRIGKEPPKGPRNNMTRNVQNAATAMSNGRGMTPAMGGGMQMMPGAMHGQRPGPGFNPQAMQFDPAAQMAQMYSIFEQVARDMAQQAVQQGTPGQFINPQFQQNGAGRGNPLFDRASRGGRGNFKNRGGQHSSGQGRKHQQQQDTEMADTSQKEGATENSMDVDGGSSEPKDPSQTVCRFNLGCTKTDCPFVHQSPAAPPGVTIDMSDTCSFGAACKNSKCAGKHPSPAQRIAHNAEKDCKFWPNCQNPNCTFRHPETTMPMCRNGGDCKVEGCKFAHTRVACKFKPCTNPHCPYKHEEGQKIGNVWKRTESAASDGHKSERKFVEEGNEDEELVTPGSGGQDPLTVTS